MILIEKWESFCVETKRLGTEKMSQAKSEAEKIIQSGHSHSHKVKKVRSQWESGVQRRSGRRSSFFVSWVKRTPDRTFWSEKKFLNFFFFEILSDLSHKPHLYYINNLYSQNFLTSRRFLDFYVNMQFILLLYLGWNLEENHRRNVGRFRLVFKALSFDLPSLNPIDGIWLAGVILKTRISRINGNSKTNAPKYLSSS